MILIDDRMGSRDLIKHPPLSSLGELTRLESADVCFAGNGPGNSPLLIGVEVKTIGDLVSSLQSGRLQAEQIPKMLSTYDESWLAFYGSYREGRDGQLQVKNRKTNSWVNYSHGNKHHLPFSFLESFLCSPSFTSLGIHVKHVPEIEELASWIGILYSSWSKDWGKHKSMRTFNRSAEACFPELGKGKEVEKGIALAASSLPGIKFERGVACANHFRSIHEMMNAGEKEWEGVEGIGKVIAKSVVSAIRRERK